MATYTDERDQFVAAMAREKLPLYVTRNLLRWATTLNRLAELACSSEAADRDRVPCPQTSRTLRPWSPCLCDGDHDAGPRAIPRIRLQEWHTERHVQTAIDDANDRLYPGRDWRAEGLPAWRVLTAGDPRGYTLRVIPPSYADENARRSPDDPRSIGVPARDSGIRW